MHPFWGGSRILIKADYFNVVSFTNPTNSGTAGAILPSPKLSLIFGPRAKTQFYVQGGFGFHSNDGRAAT